ncbi:10738_t:CDS:2 [Funneliformis geosporum]|uniref:CDP-diacylglycerol--inositol 3-phosphatidyltransferase n=1 Tax=Funneliformis geosporum TaxID=1117311 RepID=A0A9W4SJD1_9GLOM|nr:2548_t:CDS:2 [Funneliformis geosporum]CAI2172005.1 10738_t:CDS:2 [Funneliformis geosporum]
MANKNKQQHKQSSPSRKVQETKENVFLFIPNIIGFTRVILAILSLYYMPNQPWTCMGLYIISCLLDAVDGNAARYFKQCSKFGAVLDMVTDRSTTSCLLCFLATKYPSWTILFQLLISLDLSSHYMHIYSSLTSGSSSHKHVSKSSNFILHSYYSDNRVLFIFCALNELFFVALYLLSFDHEGLAPWLNITIKSIAFLSFPICAGKQIINVIQLTRASQTLANIDLAERRKI